MSDSGLNRSKNKVIGGVCAGIAKSMGYDSLWVRLFFVLIAIMTGGFAAIIYLILWAIMPSE
jgi:phage shock protein PspC (stress-responsive transcriptional regulator)